MQQKATKREHLPKSVRQIVYSFLPLDFLIQMISKLSHADRKLLVTSEILDQPRSLKITFTDAFIYDINSLKYMMKLLINKKSKHGEAVSSLGLKSGSSSAVVRSATTSLPILNQNLLHTLLETNSDMANQIFRQEIDERSNSNTSVNSAREGSGEATDAATTTAEGAHQVGQGARGSTQRVGAPDSTDREKRQARHFNQKRADVQLQIECEQPQMIPFVRYVLGKALKYQLDVHILLECIKNSTESQLLSRYAQIKEFLAKSVKGFEQPIVGIDVIIKKRENQRVSTTQSVGSHSDSGTNGYQQSPSIFPMRTVIAWLNELSMLHQIQKLSIVIQDQNSALLLTDCSNFSICQSIRVLNLQWPQGFVNEGFFFRQFVNVQHLILKLPSDYLRRINFSLMNQLQTLEITTDFICSNFDHYEQSYSEFSGVSIGGDLDNNHCKGIDYSQLQLPTNHVLKHLKINYQNKIRSKDRGQQSGVPGAGGQLPGSRSTAVLYNTLVPGYDHSENQTILYPQIQSSENNSSHHEQALPRVEKITIFVNEIYKQVDQSSLERQNQSLAVSSPSHHFLNPNSISMQVPSPDFSYGAFKHIQAGVTRSPYNSHFLNHQQEMSEIQSLPSVRQFKRQHESLDQQILRESGALHGYSLIRLQRKDSKPKQEEPCKTIINIYFKKIQINYNFKVNITAI